jgi:hypothetical protein
MIGKLLQIALVTAPLFLGSCSKQEPASAQKPVNVQGQVFVIQKNRVNVKLGGVDIYYVPLEVFRERCHWIAANNAKATLIEDYEKDLRRIDSAIRTAEREKHAGKIHEFLTSARRLQLDAWDRFEKNPLVKDYQRLSLIEKENREFFEESGFGASQEQQWALSALFFEWLPRCSVVSTQTDADGNYHLVLPAPGNGLLFAQSSRQMGGADFENYFWIQEVSSTTTGPVHLSTNTLLTPAILGGFIHQATAPARTSVKLVTDEFELRDLSWFTVAEPLLREVAKNEDSVAELKDRIKEVAAEIEETKYMSTP